MANECSMKYASTMLDKTLAKHVPGTQAMNSLLPVSPTYVAVGRENDAIKCILTATYVRKTVSGTIRSLPITRSAKIPALNKMNQSAQWEHSDYLITGRKI